MPVRLGASSEPRQDRGRVLKRGNHPYACPGCEGELSGGASGSSSAGAGFSSLMPLPSATLSWNLDWNGSLRCGTCGAIYPVEEGIPDFVPSGVVEYDDFLVAWFEKYNLEQKPTFLDSLGDPAFEEALLSVLGMKSGDEGELADDENGTQAMPADRPEMILDLCCGWGGLGRWLSGKGHSVFFADISSEALRHVSAFFARDPHSCLSISSNPIADVPLTTQSAGEWGSAGLMTSSGKFEYRSGPLPAARASVLNLPYGAGSFDRVLVAYTYHNWSVRQYRLRALAEIRRILKPGGRIDLLWIPNWWPRLFAPGNWYSPTRLGVHVFRNVMGYFPLAPSEAVAEVQTFFEPMAPRPSPGSKTGGVFSCFLGAGSGLWSLAIDSFCVSGRTSFV